MTRTLENGNKKKHIHALCIRRLFTLSLNYLPFAPDATISFMCNFYFFHPCLHLREDKKSKGNSDLIPSHSGVRIRNSIACNILFIKYSKYYYGRAVVNFLIFRPSKQSCDEFSYIFQKVGRYINFADALARFATARKFLRTRRVALKRKKKMQRISGRVHVQFVCSNF